MISYCPSVHDLDLKQPVALIRTVLDNQTMTEAMHKTEQIHQIQVGQATYILSRALRGCYDPITAEYTVIGLPYVGKGPTHQSARDDWEKEFHVRLQELYAKRPFEMAPSERNEWQLLQSVVDLNDLANRTPVVLRLVGQIIKKRPFFRIRWLDGRHSSLDYQNTPSELAGFALGRWFEAIGKYDPRTSTLLNLDAVVPIASPPPPGSPALQAFLESLRGASELADAQI